MADFTHKETEHFTRQQTAQRLRSLADAIDARGACEFNIDGDAITIPVGDGVRVRRKLKSKGEHFSIELDLSWSTSHVSAAVAQSGSGPSPIYDPNSGR
jgi:amphi-Trp domain-containing protein